MSINACWTLSSNVGDQLTPYIIRKLTGKDPVYAMGGADYTHYILSGSMLNHANEHSVVWGAGLASMGDGVHPSANLLAVRGPISRMRAYACDARCPRVYGDPAMILPELYEPKRVKKHALGIVPHYVDAFRASQWYPERHVINVLQPVESFVDEVVSCEAIISSSLHGIIIAHAYGIPAVWVKFSDSIGGDGTKYRDYFMSVYGDQELPVDLREGGICDVPSRVPAHNVQEFRGACPIK
jgi:pyruvyltransferase